MRKNKFENMSLEEAYTRKMKVRIISCKEDRTSVKPRKKRFICRIDKDPISQQYLFIPMFSTNLLICCKSNCTFGEFPGFQKSMTDYPTF